MRSQLLTLLLPLALGSVLQASCDTLASPVAAANNDTISVGNYYFAPSPDTLTAGTNDLATVTFIWGIGNQYHNVTWDTGPGGGLPPNSPTQLAGMYTVMLATGTYTYHSTVQMDVVERMSGTIVVLPRAP
ncbi:MAG: hypothetical protein DMD49_03305 [Gemmatimonadetes bacterium]|nr:MAG: hypothetical protein DMD28_06985 [Gemmatimonadota bacterium]PYP33479.1 MAG: hypothetical protein DMD49_03305 [Gemmatimonadota bacterium]